jgi:large subunit ribosomal protein L21
MAYAIIRAGGKQFRVEPGQKLRLPSIDLPAGSKVEFDAVLLRNDGQKIEVGAPTIPGAKVVGEVLRHGRGAKIVVFKFKRRKNYARKQGHRQGFTEVRIDGIAAS